MDVPSFENVIIEPLSDKHAVDAFDCGDQVRNSWLCRRALSNQGSDDSRTYVMAHGRDVLGFYAIATSSVLRRDLPAAMRRNAPDPISCVLLAQLAVETSCQGQGLTRPLIVHAMRNATRIADIAGCRLLTVHPATPDLVDFWRKAGFSVTSATPALMAVSIRFVRERLADVEPA